ncbi:hypothetical protein [Streptomyces sp. NPDC001851]|uniref:hypothetical protein n=1 Tax=Streptomyces sp. NPDC001851 TaxID=3154529 RepID=UPI0033275E10
MDWTPLRASSSSCSAFKDLEEAAASEHQAQLLLGKVAEGPASGSLGFRRAGGVFGEGVLVEVFQSVADELEGLVLGWQLLAPLVSETGAPGWEVFLSTIKFSPAWAV